MSAPRDFTSASYVFVLLLRFVALVLLLLGASGSLGHLHWRLELVTHWLPQLAVATGLCCVVLAAKREWVLAARLLGATGLLGVQVAPWVKSPEAGTVPGPPFTVFYANVLRVNQNTVGLAEQIALADPDVVVLVEVDRRWLSELKPALDGYGEVVEHPQDNNFGIALYSRLPLVSAEVVHFGPEHEIDAPAIVASLLVQGTPVKLYGVHTLPPAAAQFAGHRDLQLQALAQQVAAQQGPVLVVGDLNTTMYAQSHKDLVATGGLRNARRGKGRMGTWPSGMSSLMRIPIDHVLVSPELQVLGLQVGDRTGSDHLPLIAELALGAD
jgi:endonuclease/exonuclease/phosphatase (EEP) superfamily protein YafD